MFEEEAKEYTSNLLKDVNCNIGNPRTRQINSIDIEDTFKYAAEFGYNKANEWHYVKDGLPELDTNVLVIHKWHRTPEVGKRITVFSHSSVWVWAMCCDRYRYTSEDKDVIAWKEIVLPELKESE